MVIRHGPGSGGRIFYGWAIVAAVFVMLAVSAGLAFYNMTIYLRALVAEQGFSVGAVSSATAVFFLVGGLSGPLVARLIDRYDPRLTIVAGALGGGIALLALGQVRELWQLYAVYTLLGVGFAASSLVPGTTLVARWFTRRRSVALSVASTGLSVGGLLITPLTDVLLRTRGLPGVAPWLAAGYLLGIAPVAALVVRAEPGRMGLSPDGDPSPPGTALDAAGGTTFALARRSRFFLAVTGAYVLAMAAQVGGFSHVNNLVSERLDLTTAAQAVSAIALASVVGRLIGGWLVTKVSMRGFTAGMMVVQAGSLVALAVSVQRGALLAAAVAFGLTIGNLLMLHPLLLADAFGLRDYARIYSVSQLVATVGIAAGPALVGALYDATGGYLLPLVLIAAASLLAAGTLAASGPAPASA